MLTLLAESKTMTPQQRAISEDEFNRHKPVFEDLADDIMRYFESLSPQEISEMLSISGSLGVKSHNLAYDFPHKLTGEKALEAFTGEAFKGLDISTFSPIARERANQDLRLISSVYGILKPDDIIKPYRSEFNKPVTADHKTAIQLFKPKVTVELANYVKENKIADIIDLLPADADKCIDWKIIRSFAKVHKVVFQQVLPDGRLKTPLAKRLKELRGLMARAIMMDGISSFTELTRYSSDHFIFSPEHSKPLLPVFLAD